MEITYFTWKLHLQPLIVIVLCQHKQDREANNDRSIALDLLHPLSRQLSKEHRFAFGSFLRNLSLSKTDLVIIFETTGRYPEPSFKGLFPVCWAKCALVQRLRSRKWLVHAQTVACAPMLNCCQHYKPGAGSARYLIALLHYNCDTMRWKKGNTVFC